MLKIRCSDIAGATQAAEKALQVEIGRMRVMCGVCCCVVVLHHGLVVLHHGRMRMLEYTWSWWIGAPLSVTNNFRWLMCVVFRVSCVCVCDTGSFRYGSIVGYPHSTEAE